MAQTQITPDLIKQLRERTGIGIGKCKEALEKADGNIEQAIADLRKAGMTSAVKKEGRTAKEGMIVIGQSKDTIAVVEINAETDFVVQNERFKEFSRLIAEEIAQKTPESLEVLLAQEYSGDPSLTVDQYRATLVQAIGENIQIRRFKLFKKKENSSFGAYSHMNGKIVTVVEVTGDSGEDALAKDIAMHIAAAAPEYLSPESVPEETINHEKEIAKSQIQGKPENIIEKIVEGKLRAFFDSVCLSHQKYIRDDALTVEEIVQRRAKETGKTLALSGFLRWNVGQDVG